MEILGIKVLEITITDPFGNRDKFKILDENEYLTQMVRMQCEIDDFLKDELKFK